MTTTAGPPPDERQQWLDVARGTGILLVVLGHTLGGLVDSPLGAGQLWLRQAFFCIYIVHMPLFFMLSGALVSRRLDRDRSAFLSALMTDILWPYLLWSVIQSTIIYLLGSLTNQPIPALLPMLLALPVLPVSQFWFLYAILVLHLLAWSAGRPLGRAGMLLLCLALKPMPQLVPDLPVVVRLVMSQAPWYGIGLFLGAGGLHDIVVARPAWVRLLLPVGASLLIAVALFASPGFEPAADLATAPAPAIAGLAWNPAAFPAALLGAFAVLGLAGFEVAGAAGILALLGRRSMAIFVLHIMALAAVRIAMTRLLGVTNLRLLIPPMVMAGVILPLFAFAVAQRFGATRIAGLGRP